MKKLVVTTMAILISGCGTLIKTPVKQTETIHTIQTKKWKVLDKDQPASKKVDVISQSRMNSLSHTKGFPHVGKAKYSFGTPSSTLVVADTGGNADVYTNGRIEIPINIYRYVGDKKLAIENGLLSKKTTIRFPLFDYDMNDKDCAERNVARINGVIPRGKIAGDDDVWRMVTLVIDTEKLNFPSKPGSVGKNSFTLDVNVNKCNTDWLSEVDWVSLKFQAATPILFVHGILDKGSKAWPTFKKALDQKGMVSDLSIDLPYEKFKRDFVKNPESCSDGSYTSVKKNAIHIIQKAKEIGRKYGVESFHIVAHSKGGIDSKAALGILKDIPIVGNYTINSGSFKINRKIKFNSLITLNTPYLGSPVADLGILILLKDLDKKYKEDYDKITQGKLSMLFTSNKLINHLLSEDHVCDLVQGVAKANNSKYKLRIPAFGTITDASSKNHPKHNLSRADGNMKGTFWLAATEMDFLYKFTGNTLYLKYEKGKNNDEYTGKVEQIAKKSWYPNDILVTPVSASGGTKGYLAFNTSIKGENHTDVVSGRVMKKVIDKAYSGFNGVNWGKLK